MDKISILCIAIAAACVTGSILFVIFQNRKQRQITERLRRMLEAAQAGRFSESGFDESVCSALENEMADYLNASEKSMKAAAAEKEKIKTLIADISHQTKTPIANLLLYTQLLAERETDPDAEESLTAIQKQAEKLNFLIGSLIKCRDWKRGSYPSSPGAGYQRNAVGDHCLLQRKGRAEGLELKDLSEPVRVCFDRKWTAEAIGNILDNAVKYTDREALRSARNSMNCLPAVEVEDTGRGLDEEEIPLVFRRFRRGEETQDQDGVGIGLYLAREILAGEGGYIRISSEKGRGSVFSVFLPNRIKENLSELS